MIYPWGKILLAVTMLFIFDACRTKETAHQDIYTCPMHPTVVTDKPGTCPVCGMELVRKAREGEEVKVTSDLAQRTKSPNEVVITDIATVKGEHKKLSITLPAQGVVTYDTRYISSIPARIGGRLEKVYMKYVFQSVQKGQAIAEIYSPELLAAQREYLFLLKNDAGNTALIESAKNKLYLLGMSAKQLEALAHRQEPPQTYTIYSPASGYIIAANTAAPSVNASTTASPANDMGGSSMSGNSPAASTSAATTQPSGSLVREGSYINTGETLFTVVNTSALRIELSVPINDSNVLKKGDVISLDTGTDSKQKATVDFVQPFFDQNQSFIKVRVYIAPAEKLSVGQLIQATVTLPEIEGLWVPRESVVDLGLNKVVFAQRNGIFKPLPVTTSIYSGTLVSVKGISSTDVIAANAQYLVDSESFIKAKP